MTLVDRFSRRQFTAAMALAMALALLMSGSALAQTPPSAVVIDDSCNNVPDDGFPDVPETNTFDDEIECLKAYGITVGKADGTYGPDGKVSRWQMALFIYRLAKIADDQLSALTLPSPSDQGFTDLAGVDPDAVDAINVLAAIGVVQGKTATMFDPWSNIRRDQMASFINRLQGAIQDALGGDAAGFTTASDFFPDDDGNVHEDNINGLASVGIVQGKTNGNYNPFERVNRGQMAAFVMRHVEVNVDNNVLTSAYPPGAMGVVTDVSSKGTASSPGEYDYVVNGDDEETTVNIDDDDEFTVDGSDATLSAFIGALTVADEVNVVKDGASNGTDNLHELTNVDPADITSGTVGNVDFLDDEFDIIEPVSGAALRSDVAYGGELYETDGSDATESEFEDDINEGDDIEIKGDSTKTFELTNNTLDGTVMDPATAAAGEFRVGNLGDDPADDTDDDFDSDGATITIDGESSNEATFDADVSEGDDITYEREDGDVTITLENEAPPTIEGTVVDRSNANGGKTSGDDTIDDANDEFTIIDDDGDTTVIDYTDGDLKLNGSVAGVSDFDDEVTAGDQVVYQPADAGSSTDEEIAVTDADLEGYADDYVAPADPAPGGGGTDGSYDVYLTQKGAQDADADLLLQDDVEFSEVAGDDDGDVDAEDDGNNDYFVAGSNVNLLEFIDNTEAVNIDDAAEDNDPITVVLDATTRQHRLAE